MKFTPEQVQEAFEKQLDGREPYYYWKEIPPSKVWYDKTDNCFHTSAASYRFYSPGSQSTPRR